MTIRTYSEMSKLCTIEERFDYLKLNGKVGNETFGWQRWLNQVFYKSGEWLSVRDKVIARDLGYDLGIKDYEISGAITVHHMNPVTENDIKFHMDKLLDIELLISCSHLTHMAITYGNRNLLPKDLTVRTKNDTCPWRQ